MRNLQALYLGKVPVEVIGWRTWETIFYLQKIDTTVVVMWRFGFQEVPARLIGFPENEFMSTQITDKVSAEIRVFAARV